MFVRRLSSYVRIFEVGPRDGLQNEKIHVPTPIKIDFVNRLSRTGLSCIEVTSFVSPKWVPQMADHVEVLDGIERVPGVRYSALTPNVQGLNKALSLGKKGVDEVAIFAAASESFSKKNINCSIETSLQRFEEVMKVAREHQLPVRGSISCAVGCPYEGKSVPAQVVPLVEKLLDMGCVSSNLISTLLLSKPRRLLPSSSMKSPWLIPLVWAHRNPFENCSWPYLLVVSHPRNWPSTVMTPMGRR